MDASLTFLSSADVCSLQTADPEEPRLRGVLQDQAAGAEGRAGVREGQGVRGPGQAPGGDTSIHNIELEMFCSYLIL